MLERKVIMIDKKYIFFNYLMSNVMKFSNRKWTIISGRRRHISFDCFLRAWGNIDKISK